MQRPQYFQRSPRIKKGIPYGTVEVHRPPAPPAPPKLSLISMLLPAGMTAASVLLLVMLNPNQNSSYLVVQLISMSTMAVSYLVPFLTHLSNKREYKREKAERESKYEAQLESHRKELEKVRELQKSVMLDTDPPPEECVRRIREWSGEVWNRSPQEEDFLHLRLGVGDQPFCIRIKAPEQDGYEKEPLIEAAQKLDDDYRTVSHVPVQLPVFESKVIGIVGDRQAAENMVRVLALQLAAHHAPDEVKVGAFFGEEEARRWEWMRWLPHTWEDDRKTRYLAKDMSTTRQALDALYHVLHPRKLASSPGREAEMKLPAWVFFLSDIRPMEDEPLVHLLLREAEALSACTFILSDRRETLPKECGMILEVTLGEGRLLETASGQSGVTGRERYFIPDRITLEQADEAARLLAPYRLRKSAAGELPRVLTLYDMFGVRETGELSAAAHWSKNRYPDTLPVTVGVRAGGKPVQLNIHDKIERRGHGPHGLIAGTTGSGKSEVIQSLIASLALQFHPHELAFMLIDYKGGGMSNTFARLPHLIASITNLEGKGVMDRAQVSLKAELARRQRILNAAGNLQHIDEYYRSPYRDKEPLPHLVIVIDEFAELKKEQPDFMSELISIAAIGRTLGVHLILATQKPAGVVDDKIWSNARFRICLRVQDEADSRDMLRVPDAARISNPGRGYFQVGSNEVFELVQFAWSGAPYRPEAASAAVEAEAYTVALNGTRHRCAAPAAASRAGDRLDERKQLQVFIDYLAEIARAEGIEPLPGPWTPPLPAELFLGDLRDGSSGWNGAGWQPAEGWLQPALGLIDDLANQVQRPLCFPLEEGHLLIYGMPGTGKTTMLQTLLLGLASEHHPEDVQFYVLDFGRMLKDFDPLPHTGAVIQQEEAEKVRRLFRFLAGQLDQRKQLFSEAGVKSLETYRKVTGSAMPAVFTVMDGYLSFKDAYPDEHDRWEALLREGASLGLYFVVTANRVSDMFDKIRSNFPLAFSFELADPSDYYFAVGRPVRPLSQAPEGRGLLKGAVPPLEGQIALPAGGADEFERTRAIRETVKRMSEAWNGPRAFRIPVLPEIVSLGALLDGEYGGAADGGAADRPGAKEAVLRVPVGLETEELTLFCPDLRDGPVFVVGSRMEGGKTALLSSWVLALAGANRPEALQLVLADFRRTPSGLYALRQLPHVTGCAVDEDSLLTLLGPLREELERRKFLLQSEGDGAVGASFPAIVLAIDDGEAVARQIGMSYELQGHLEWILKQARGLGVYILFGCIPAEIGNCFDSWTGPVKSAQTGFLLGTTESADLNLFNLKLPYAETGKSLPSGEGFYVRRRHAPFKGALPFTGGAGPEEWVRRITESVGPMAGRMS
ncbi:type VII secretion protein EssC [Paenibacillus mucilaginosus]|uniref:FtsK/SpoIIIE family protein n=1 Tax=Paenibacillus mucilaginosus (strain KNP414) TaxID=1036673 RepID=F8FP74_PAEMK|nr:type VII secretion protein EssC [Paenibacillus mucilaginosus]AEI39024.1 FtsK/SpoIIIE family protein [Paenibacillus mucilaginosus KNP414]MCG7216158.1 type VII secretion protein EssC [Paenibacillus mucilaginosus]WDM28062.1 type VII secretion protein EssC [Paenibacillus mucilaginosus]